MQPIKMFQLNRPEPKRILAVLGHQLEKHDEMSSIMHQRLLRALDVYRYHEGYLPFDHVILSGGITELGQQLSEAQVMFNFLAPKISLDKIICDHDSLDTRENVAAMVRIVKELYPDQPVELAIVTHVWHVSRVSRLLLAKLKGRRDIHYFFQPVFRSLPFWERQKERLRAFLTWLDPDFRILPKPIAPDKSYQLMEL
ncbi:MAG: hypothetical protein A2808_00980 [Candidatus Moranbacteria bacterium RIFCSPHIGHO2_01_FULL_55_24]|nr:MAG: hypothetical protein A2808_00980 [Candidatus Moranbacteria bacterium RIFCSPHIGHO2_01_FULL_55_24]